MLTVAAAAAAVTTQDIVSARRALEKYCDICPSFDREREYKLLDVRHPRIRLLFIFLFVNTLNSFVLLRSFSGHHERVRELRRGIVHQRRGGL